MERTISHSELRTLLKDPGSTVFLDLRRKADFDADSVMMPGARWFNPDEIGEWSATLPKDREIILYCVHGKAVSNMAVDHLGGNGCRARFVEGGMEGWKAAGGATMPKPK